MPKRGVSCVGMAANLRGLPFVWMPRCCSGTLIFRSNRRAIIGQMASPTVKSCAERDRLRRAYAKVALTYHELSIVRIGQIIEGVDVPESQEISDAKLRMENAHIALLAHRKKHGC